MKKTDVRKLASKPKEYVINKRKEIPYEANPLTYPKKTIIKPPYPRLMPQSDNNSLKNIESILRQMKNIMYQDFKNSSQKEGQVKRQGQVKSLMKIKETFVLPNKTNKLMSTHARLRFNN